VSGLNLQLLGPEWALAATALALLLADLILPRSASRRSLGLVAATGMALGLALSLCPASQAQAFGGSWLGDGLTQALRQVLLMAGLLTALISMPYLEKGPLSSVGEYWLLLVFGLLGLLFMAAAGDLLTLYVALETSSLAFYALTAIRKERSALSVEGGLKYLLLSATATALLLYGISLVYGATGTVTLSRIAVQMARPVGDPALLLAGTALLVAGFGFKLALVPFHFWAPDAYQAAPTPVAGLLSVGSKAAAMAAAVRLFAIALGQAGDVTSLWALLFALLAAASMGFANLLALKQKDLKRFLAFSSISQAGTLVLGLLANSAMGLSSITYFLAAYVFGNLAAFAVVQEVWSATGAEDLDGLRGLHQRAPLRALALLLAMLSLAGIPPLAGFFAKFYLFAAAARSGWWWLVAWAIANSVVSLFYYLVVAKRMYLEDPAEGQAPLPPARPAMALALAICIGMTLVMGLFPGYFIHWLEVALR
jgi:NADH-quinone oxidoreductase subunit N